jgi:GntR family transcriptional regulator
MSWPSRADRIDHSDVERGYVWQQIADDITSQIESGELPPGAKLPSGPELASIYGVAKATTAKAVEALRGEGVVTVVLGRGTYVTRRG